MNTAILGRLFKLYFPTRGIRPRPRLVTSAQRVLHACPVRALSCLVDEAGTIYPPEHFVLELPPHPALVERPAPIRGQDVLRATANFRSPGTLLARSRALVVPHDCVPPRMITAITSPSTDRSLMALGNIEDCGFQQYPYTLRCFKCPPRIASIYGPASAHRQATLQCIHSRIIRQAHSAVSDRQIEIRTKNGLIPSERRKSVCFRSWCMYCFIVSQFTEKEGRQRKHKPAKKTKMVVIVTSVHVFPLEIEWSWFINITAGQRCGVVRMLKEGTYVQNVKERGHV